MICASLYARLGAAFSRPVHSTGKSHFSSDRLRKAAATTATLCAIAFAPAAVQAQGLLNGTFEDRSGVPAVGDCITGDSVNQRPPSPWGRQSTPDYSTERQIAFDSDKRERADLVPAFDVSPSGGCFMGFRSLSLTANEGIFQTITITDADQSLVWQYDYTEYTQPDRARCQPRVEFRVNGNDVSNGTSISLAPTIGAPGGPSREGEWVIARTNSFKPSDFGKSDGDTMDVYVGVIANGCLTTWGYVDSISIIAAPVSPSDDSTLLNGDDTAAGVTAALNLFDGDTAGSDPASLANTTIAVSSGSAVPAGLVLRPDGTVDVTAGTAPGVYSFDYELCSLDTVPVCETATATITVTPEIEATPEVFDTYGPAGGTTPSVLTSDTLNGDPADLTTVDITAPVPGDYKDASGQPVTGLTLDPATGLITIDPGLAAGDYFVDYEICTKAAPVTCSTTTETITIGVPKLTLTLESGVVGTGGGNNPSVTDPGDTVPYTLTVTNDGDVTMEDIEITSPDLTNIVCTPTTLAPGETASCTADPHVITVDDFNAGGIEKSATVTGSSTAGPAEDVSDTRNNGGSETSDDPDLSGGTDGDPTSDPTIVLLAPLPAVSGDIAVTKTANLSLVNYGDSVTYTLIYENTSALNIAALDLLDELPGGLAYTPGTAQLDGVATEPSVAGRQLTWEDVDIAAGASVEVTLSVRVLPDSATQELMNSAWAIQDGDVVSNIGTATIRIRPEHVFHCSDVIGKVFDDRNGNGIQDGPDNLAGLTDQTVTGGKFDSAPAAENRGEPGLAGVRLVTVNGHLITTDAYGRFHVPCAALPADGGSNFTLKVDTRTLPSGYRMTTENPRVLRLTAGRFGRMNFGASIADVARIDLDATAFTTDRQSGERVAIEALDQALRAMLNDPSNPVSVVHLRYHRTDGETPRMARRHLDLVEDILNDAWTGQSGTRLLVERETLRLNQ